MNSRVLLVEDDLDDEALTLRALRNASHHLDVQVARDGVEALRALGIRLPEPNPKLPNLVLLDIKLPKVTGLEVLRHIRRSPQHEGLPVVLLTSSDEPSDVIAASMLSVSKYVRKAMDYDEFMESVKEIVQDYCRN